MSFSSLGRRSSLLTTNSYIQDHSFRAPPHLGFSVYENSRPKPQSDPGSDHFRISKRIDPLWCPGVCPRMTCVHDTEHEANPLDQKICDAKTTAFPTNNFRETSLFFVRSIDKAVQNPRLVFCLFVSDCFWTRLLNEEFFSPG